MILQVVQEYFKSRPVLPGETIQVGWLIFRVTNNIHPIQIESLDFKSIASFTDDLTEAEAIFEMQLNALRARAAEEEPCTLRHSAVVSKSYVPGHPQAFLKRDSIASDRDSGWYVGMFDDPIDFNDPNSFLTRSLYELSIADRRMLPYWLLPVSTQVSLDTAVVE